MTESQREIVPSNDAGELDTALAFLRFGRHCLLKKTDGLDDEQLRRVLVGSGTTLLGLIQHNTVGERYWLAYQFAGRGPEQEFDFGMDVPRDRGAAEVIGDYRQSIRESDEIILSSGDPDALSARPIHGEPRTLRWVLAHMTSETARHAGHADILREQIDGVTGR